MFFKSGAAAGMVLFASLVSTSVLAMPLDVRATSEASAWKCPTEAGVYEIIPPVAEGEKDTFSVGPSSGGLAKVKVDAEKGGPVFTLTKKDSGFTIQGDSGFASASGSSVALGGDQTVWTIADGGDGYCLIKSSSNGWAVDGSGKVTLSTPVGFLFNPVPADGAGAEGSDQAPADEGADDGNLQRRGEDYDDDEDDDSDLGKRADPGLDTDGSDGPEEVQEQQPKQKRAPAPGWTDSRGRWHPGPRPNRFKPTPYPNRHNSFRPAFRPPPPRFGRYNKRAPAPQRWTDRYGRVHYGPRPAAYRPYGRPARAPRPFRPGRRY